MIIIFENFKTKPDLRKIGEYVLCIKDYHFESRQIINFTKGVYYKVGGRYGDPQRAVEEFGIIDYMPVECISRVYIPDDKKRPQEFDVNPHYRPSRMLPKFFDYFEIPEFTEDITKYNL